jgi:hypothetical protein
MMHGASMEFGTQLRGLQALECPSCGCDCIHHDRITAYDRIEDAPQTIVTKLTGGQVTMRMTPSGQARNPSSRRHAVAIRFWRESCPAKAELTIEQHKGATFLVWRKSSPDRMTVIGGGQP